MTVPRISAEARQIFDELNPPGEGRPKDTTFRMVVTKGHLEIGLDFRDDTTLTQARKLAGDMRRALKPGSSVRLLLDEEYGVRT